MRTALATGALALAAIPGAAQETTRLFHLTRTFSFEPPPGWRQITPGEAHSLKKQANNPVPEALHSSLLEGRAEDFAYGAIDSWLAGSFDGRSMTARYHSQGECSMDEAGIQTVRESVTANLDGWTREVESIEITSLGENEHPAIECTTVGKRSGLPQPVKSMVLVVPTGGDTLTISFQAWQDDFDAALPTLRRAASTLTFAREPRGEVSVTDRLLYPLVIGALVGVLLLVLGTHRRTARAPE